jgi:hypothetical protein
MSYLNFIEDPSGGQFGGFNPSMNDYARRSIRQANENAMMKEILLGDQRAKMQAALIQNTMGAKNQMGDAGVLGISSIINSRMASGLMGGSRLDMFAGMNTGFANSGTVRMVGGQNGVGDFYGSGGSMMAFSKQVMDETEKYFFNPMGGARLGRTKGLNRSDFGKLMAEFGASGAMSGWGEYENVPGAGGKSTMKVSDATITKSKDLMSKGAEVIGQLKDILGDQSMSELIGAMNSLAGGTISSVEKLQTVRKRLDAIKSMASQSGGSAEAFMSMHAQQAAAFRGVGFGEGASATMAMHSMGRTAGMLGSLSEARGYASSQGYDIPDLTDVVSAENMKDVMALSTENPEIQAMLFAINSSNKLSPEKRKELKATIRKRMGTATSSSDVRNVVSGLESEVFGATGGTSYSWTQAAGGNLNAGITRDDTNMMSEMSQEVMDRRSQIQFIQAMGEAGQDSNSAERLLKLRDKYSMATISRAATGKFDGGPADLSREDAALLQNIMNANPELMNSRNEEDVRKEAQAALVDLTAETEFGEDLAGAGGALSKIVGTLMGDTKVTDSSIRAYLRTNAADADYTIAGSAADAVKARKDGKFVDKVNGEWRIYGEGVKDKTHDLIDTELTKKTLSKAGFSDDQVKDFTEAQDDEGRSSVITNGLKDAIASKFTNAKNKRVKGDETGLDSEEADALAGLAKVSPGAQNEILKQLTERENEIRDSVKGGQGLFGTGKAKDLSDSQQAELDEIEKLRSQLTGDPDNSVVSLLNNIYTLLNSFNSRL